MSPLFILGLALAIVMGLAIFTIWHYRHHPYKPDYYFLFVAGFAWFAVGLSMDNSTLSALGLVLSVIGLANRDKWNKRETFYQAENKLLKITLLVGLLSFLVLGSIFFYMRS